VPFLEHQLRRRLRRLLGGAVLTLGVGVLQVVGDGVTGFEEEEHLIRVGAPQAPPKGHPHRILSSARVIQRAAACPRAQKSLAHLWRAPVELREDSAPQASDGGLYGGMQLREAGLRRIV
jgi:hypothetical protein